MSCLFLPSVCGHTDLIDLLENNGAELSRADVNEAYPLHYAAQMCGPAGEEADPKLGIKTLKKLLTKRLDFDCPDQDQRTPLLWAASSGVICLCLFFRSLQLQSSIAFDILRIKFNKQTCEHKKYISI